MPLLGRASPGVLSTPGSRMPSPSLVGPQPYIVPSGGGYAGTGTGSVPITPSSQSFGGNGSTGLGAGQGPGTQSTGQASDNPFNNSFFFQIPQPSGGGASGGTATTTTPPSSGYGQYLPLIVVGVVVAGLGYYLFERKK